MPQNCSSDVEAVIAYLDGMYANNDTTGIQTLKEAFGLGDLVHTDDFAAARESSCSLNPLSSDLGPIFFGLSLLTQSNSSIQPV